jgi:hypothetical protein
VARVAVTSDCYAILGVTPAAEDVVIGAAYRALIRHYHPDTNPDPAARARAQEITAAYAILRDPARRAEYDARRAAGDDFWPVEELPHRPPPMRGVGIAAALVAIALTGAVWMWPPIGLAPAPSNDAPAMVKPAAPAPPSPAELQLEPEHERLAALHRKSNPPPPAEMEQPGPEDMALAQPAPDRMPPPAPKAVRKAAPEPGPAPNAKRPAVAAAPPKLAAKTPKAAAVRPTPRPACNAECRSARMATLDRMAAGFFTQSMANADPARKDLLLSARNRSAAARSACRSDSCVTEAYLKQIRETSAIMEGRATPPN